MQITKLATVLTIGLFFAACNQNQTQPPQGTAIEPYANNANPELLDDDYWAKDNFDLQRVGGLLERSNDPAEFERYLNEDDGINNLDLNGDGYADYISVDEFDDRDSNSRGLSLFSRFGPDLIQEIATIFLYRDRPDYPGARFLIDGNDQIFGENAYYEANWQDRPLGLVSYLFSDRNDRYRSPYYYDNYPPGYAAYEVVETPYYVTRVERLYPQPVFVYTSAPTFVSNVKIKSPHYGQSMEKIYAKLAKPNRGQEEFFKNNPPRRFYGKNDDPGRRKGQDGLGDKQGRNDPPRSDRGDERGNPARDERGAERGNPNSPWKGNPDHGSGKPGKADNPGKGQRQPQVDNDKGKGKGLGQGPGPGKGGGQGKGAGQGKGGGKGKP